MTPAEAGELLDELERLAGGGGYADPAVTTRVRQILFPLKNVRPTGYVSGPIASLTDSFDRLYSARKHANPGIDALRQRIYAYTSRIRRIMKPDNHGRVD